MDSLAGIRVAEFSGGMVGPMAADLLARMGAEVIKVESQRHPDFTRLIRDPVAKGPSRLNEERQYQDLNMNKLGLRLDLKKPQGLELARRLVAQCDVLLENFSAGTIDRLGLGYPVVRKLRPDIVMISASGSGRGGRDSGTLAVAPVFAALSGLASLTGYPDDAPYEARGSCDATNSFTVTLAVLAALCYRQRTGQGQYIDYSSREGLSSLIGDAFMDYFMNGRVMSRQANRDDCMAPHNCYRCQGDDRWVSIAVATDQEWQALVQAMGHPAWAGEEKFADALSRWQNQEELDQHIHAWTQNYTPYQVMEKLQRVGVAAVASFTGEDFYTDPHLAERGVFPVVEHPVMGALMELACPWKLSATPPAELRPAPLFGQHNPFIIGELLGLTPPEIAELEKAQVLW